MKWTAAQSSLSPFRIPTIIPASQQVDFCIGVINRYRGELPQLRAQTTILKRQKESAEKEAVYWREKYNNEKTRNEILRRENNKLKEEIDKLTKTNNRYSIALFDHGNFKHPFNTDKKKKGGQAGHLDTNRESDEDYSSYERRRIYAKTCGKCGSKLKRVNAIKQKIFIDIVLNPEVVKMILQSERQWCRKCKTIVTARDSQSLPFTEYGINTFMTVMVLRFKCHSSFANIATVISINHGLKLSISDVSNILKQAKLYLKSKYDALIDKVRKGEIIYSDETGWLVAGESAWMWIMANEETTVYFAAESRGKGIAEELYGNSQAYSMHDGLLSYQSSARPGKQMFCWSHMLRFAFEETVSEKEDSPAAFLRDTLVRIYRIKKNHPEYSLKILKNILEENLGRILKIPAINQLIINIQNRLKTQKEGLINSLLYTTDGTNNLAERELRSIVIDKKISNGSNTFQGMETTAILGTIIRTFSRKKENLLTELELSLQIGIHEKYPQYQHLPYIDSS